MNLDEFQRLKAEVYSAESREEALNLSGLLLAKVGDRKSTPRQNVPQSAACSLSPHRYTANCCRPADRLLRLTTLQ